MEIESSTSGLTEEETEYAASYLKTGIMRGITYQLKLLTWVAWNLTDKKYNKPNISDWRLATEVLNARGFHDLVLKYVGCHSDEDGNILNRKYLYRFVQIKHKTNLTNVAKISIGHLISQKHIERQYSLIYLFKSYLNMLDKFEHITPDQIVDLTVFTNNDIGALKFLKPEEEDNIFRFTGRGNRYRIDLNMFLIHPRMLLCLRQIKLDDILIFGFLKKLVFAVNQPSEWELQELIIRDMSKSYSFPEILYDNLYKNIIEWFLIYKNGKAPYLTEENVMQYIQKTHENLLKTKNTETFFINSLSKLTDGIKSLSI